MRYMSVCSGIEAATVAWHPLGWKAAAFSEIEAFPRAVLSHHYPDTPLHGDFTTIGADDYGPIDLLVGGTPCQSFSIAGLRKGLADERGNLALEFLRLADRKSPRWVVWENVPGVLSSGGGRDFGAFLGGLAELGYGFAYRVLDAQYFGVAQRRRRVFVVGYLGDWRRAAAVLFERHSLSGHPAPRREKGPRVAALTANGVGTCGADDNQAQAGHLIASTDIARTLMAKHTRHDPELESYAIAHVPTVARALKARHDGSPCDDRGPDIIAFTAKDHGADASDISPTLRSGSHSGSHANGGVMPAVAIPIDMRQASRGATMTNNRAEGSSGGAPGTGIGEDGDPAPTVSTSHTPAVAFSENQQGAVWEADTAQALNKGGGKPGQGYAAVRQASAVRRLTPRECERLQGFPDDYSLVPYRGKPAADGPRYKALGNSMAVPVMSWIGRRIAQVEALAIERRAA